MLGIWRTAGLVRWVVSASTPRHNVIFRDISEKEGLFSSGYKAPMVGREELEGMSKEQLIEWALINQQPIE